MSSDMKDARWGLAMHYAKLQDEDWYEIDHVFKSNLLSEAQRELEMYPRDIPYWANEFRAND